MHPVQRIAARLAARWMETQMHSTPQQPVLTLLSDKARRLLAAHDQEVQRARPA